jgi:transposase-like protein
MDAPTTLQKAIIYFSDFDRCQQFMIAIRWPDGKVRCPECGSDNVSFLQNQRRWKCYEDHPRAQFSLKVGTIFEDSPLGLDKWLTAVWLVVNCKNGISSYEIGRDIGVTQKSAWHMAHRIRLALQAGSFGKIAGEVEVDETYIGGKARNMSLARRRKTGITKGRSMAGKVAVMGLLERHSKDGRSRVITRVLEGRKKDHMQPTVREHVEAGSTVNTDAHFSYQGLSREYAHMVIDHAEAYVDGTIHTNGLENYWSLLKRSIKGTYVSVEPFHLFRYLDEQAFRFNERTMTDAERFTLALSQVVGKRLTYAAVTGNVSEPSSAN